MTEVLDEDNYLVRVRAQVMTRNDGSAGWVPLSGGGLANVSVRRRAISTTPPGGSSNNTITCGSSPSNNNTSPGQGSSSTSPPPGSAKRRHEYLIYGKRITDQSVVLSCTITKDFQYNKVMPTFYHWRTGEKKFGLTFQTATDARAFDKGLRTAVEELLEGFSDANLHACSGNTDAGDEAVFMIVNLPAEPPDPRQPSEPSRGVVRAIRNYHHSQSGEIPDSHKSSIHCISSSGPTAKQHHPLESSGEVGVDNYPYVQLTTLNHDYLYPVIEDHKGINSTERRTSSGSLKKPDIIVSQPRKNPGDANCRLKCKHCQQTYTEQDNPRGACEYGPDFIGKGISTISCLLCAKCMLYHCMSDAEGENSQNIEQNPCSCSVEEGCGRRWFSLALLSLIVPCLWLYPPLRAIHWCGVTCGICGGRHHPME